VLSIVKRKRQTAVQSSTIQMTGMLQLFVRYAIEAESLYTSVERLQEYVDCCSSEGDSVPADNRPPENWPAGGKIRWFRFAMILGDN